jgi:hypothetical protein
VGRYPEETLDLLLTALGDYDARKQVLTSYVVIAAFVLMHFSDAFKEGAEPAHRQYCLSLVAALLPWTLSYLGSIRAIAQYAVRRCALDVCRHMHTS